MIELDRYNRLRQLVQANMHKGDDQLAVIYGRLTGEWVSVGVVRYVRTAAK